MLFSPPMHRDASASDALDVDYDAIETFDMGDGDGRLSSPAYADAASIAKRRASLRVLADAYGRRDAASVAAAAVGNLLRSDDIDFVDSDSSVGSPVAPTIAAQPTPRTSARKPAVFVFPPPEMRARMRPRIVYLWDRAMAFARSIATSNRVAAAFRAVAAHRSQRSGFETGETRVRAALERIATFVLSSLAAIARLQERETFERRMMQLVLRSKAPEISAKDRGLLSMQVRCTEVPSAGDASDATAGAYCRVYTGSFAKPTSRPATETFDFDVDVVDSKEPVTVEVWQPQPGGRDRVLGAFQFVPSGLPRRGRGALNLSVAWNFASRSGAAHDGDSTTYDDLMDARFDDERYELEREWRGRRSRILDEERTEFRAFADSFAMRIEQLYEDERESRFDNARQSLRVAQSIRRGIETVSPSQLAVRPEAQAMPLPLRSSSTSGDVQQHGEGYGLGRLDPAPVTAPPGATHPGVATPPSLPAPPMPRRASIVDPDTPTSSSAVSARHRDSSRHRCTACRDNDDPHHQHVAKSAEGLPSKRGQAPSTGAAVAQQHCVVLPSVGHGTLTMDERAWLATPRTNPTGDGAGRSGVSAASSAANSRSTSRRGSFVGGNFVTVGGADAMTFDVTSALVRPGAPVGKMPPVPPACSLSRRNSFQRGGVALDPVGDVSVHDV